MTDLPDGAYEHVVTRGKLEAQVALAKHIAWAITAVVPKGNRRRRPYE